LERKDELEAVIGEFLAHPGAAFLEVMIDPDAGVYPMVGPGKSYAQMITGPFIAERSESAIAPAQTADMF
ncbi:MAG: acetolactate synthase, large subunit, biosynthetic type, partial [Dokdonella sp.]|nr:acetolactate synthase, large subunit, biosynthetic type [Dokdonella sp.]